MHFLLGPRFRLEGARCGYRLSACKGLGDGCGVCRGYCLLDKGPWTRLPGWHLAHKYDVELRRFLWTSNDFRVMRSGCALGIPV